MESKKLMTINKFINDVINYQNENDCYSAIGLIYIALYDLLSAGCYNQMDNLINKIIKNDHFNLTNLIGILTVTHDYKIKLKNRKALISYVENKIRLECPADEKELMMGLI